MFDQASKRRVWWPVTFRRYDENGDVVEMRTRFRFEPLGRVAYAERRAENAKRQAEAVHFATRDLQARFGEVTETDSAKQLQEFERIAADVLAATEERLRKENARRDSDIELVRARVHDWNGITDPDTKQPVPFSPEALAAVFDSEDYTAVVLEAFDACCRGAVAKN